MKKYSELPSWLPKSEKEFDKSMDNFFKNKVIDTNIVNLLYVYFIGLI